MIKKCLFPAAGYGTRFLPATKSMPKEMYTGLYGRARTNWGKN